MRYVCKRCGAESPTGIGYVCHTFGPLPAPAADCRSGHASTTLHGWVRVAPGDVGRGTVPEASWNRPGALRPAYTDGAGVVFSPSCADAWRDAPTAVAVTFIPQYVSGAFRPFAVPVGCHIAG